MEGNRVLPEKVEGISVSEIARRVSSGERTDGCKELIFNKQNLGESDVVQLCGLLKCFTTLQKLSLFGNQLSIRGIAALCDALRDCTALTYLNLSMTSIRDDGAKLIANAIPLTRLELLEMSNNAIGQDGILAVLRGAANGSRLKNLLIDRNAGVAKSVEAIMEELPRFHPEEKLIVVLGWLKHELSEEFRQQIRPVMTECSANLEVWVDEDEANTIHGEA